MGKIKVIHLTTSVSRAAGGLFQSVRHLSQAMAVAAGGNCQLEVIGARDRHTDEDCGQWHPLPLRTHPIWGPRRFGYARGMTADLLASAPDLIHVHGIWQYSSVAVSRWSRHHQKPYVVSPHGMLEPWALRQSSLKKRVAALLYHTPVLAKAACLRATSMQEAQSIRQAGFTNPIALIPNGVHLPLNPKPDVRNRTSDVRTALFLSRLHPKKGLLNLVQAWEQARLSGWRLRVVGPDECGHLAGVRAAVRACGLENQIHFQGEVMGDEKNKCYAGADLFILPSFSENFGLVIAEALSHGVPVITTHATPWQELETHRCGWWIETGVEPLMQALREATGLNDVRRRQMGQLGRQLIETRYTWPAIAAQMWAVYEWMLGRAEKPDCLLNA